MIQEERLRNVRSITIKQAISLLRGALQEAETGTLFAAGKLALEAALILVKCSTPVPERT